MYTSTKVRDECILLPRMGHSNLLRKFGTRVAVTSVSSGVPSFDAACHSTSTKVRDDTLYSNVYWCTFIVHLPHSEAKLQLVPLMGHSNLLCKFGTRSAATRVSSGAPLRSTTLVMYTIKKIK